MNMENVDLDLIIPGDEGATFEQREQGRRLLPVTLMSCSLESKTAAIGISSFPSIILSDLIESSGKFRAIYFEFISTYCRGFRCFIDSY